MSKNDQLATSGAHLIATLETVEDVARAMDAAKLEAIGQGVADEGGAIYDQLRSMSREEREALTQGTASMRERLEECATLYDEYEEQLESDFLLMAGAGYTKCDLAGLIVPPAKWVTKQLQGEAGNGPTGHELTKQIKNCAPKGQSVRITSLLAGLTDSQIRQIREGTRCATVDEVAQLAVAYGITTGELLGIVDADEVTLLRLWRDMDQSKREALLCLLS